MSHHSAEQPSSADSLSARLRELALLFLKFGVIGFGGPAAHIALFETEVVGKRRWIDRQQFLDLLGAASLIPGPTSTETAITVGYARAGWPGLCVAGACFILPAALITGAFAWAYVRFGSLPQVAGILAGIKPAVLAVIAVAIWRLGKTAIKDWGLSVLGTLALAAFFFGLNALAILLGGGLLGDARAALHKTARHGRSRPRAAILFALARHARFFFLGGHSPVAHRHRPLLFEARSRSLWRRLRAVGVP